MPTTLDALVALVPGARSIGDGGVSIDDLSYDSRDVAPASLFFCVRGSSRDGHDFADDAIASGARALVVDHPLESPVPQVVVPDVRAAMGAMAATFFGDPSRAMEVVGVTGTNGKTTTTFLLESVMRASGATTGLLGTVECHIGERVEPVAFTTPEAIDLQRMLARMRAAGIDRLAMEVSSHGLAYGRVAGTRFACAVFTNLSRDHLDLHGSMEAYFDAKASLFTPELTARAAVNIGDPAGARIRERTAVDTVTFALDADADVRALAIEVDGTVSRVRARVATDEVSVVVPLPGPYNVANALGVLATAVALGWDLDRTVTGIERAGPVPGRMEAVDAGQPFSVLVDYAHTPDALANVLGAARALIRDGARLLVVFGCGGDRDPGKRPEMGRIATGLADEVIITSDNPRGEDPAAIIAQIETGAGAGAAWRSIVDRREAIEAAVAAAGPGDVVVIAGKGHETGQKFADVTLPFDDRVVARRALEARP